MYHMIRWKEYLGNNWFQLGYIKSVLADKSKLIMHIRGQQRKIIASNLTSITK